MTNRILLGLALLILVQGSLVSGLDCLKVSKYNIEICHEILKSNLTLEVKEAIISNLEYNSTYFPDHNYVFLRNSVIKINEAPLGIPKSQNGIIRNAWVDIFSITPSVIYNNSLIVPKNSEVFTGFSYDLILPANYHSPNYPSTTQGDCRLDYFLTSNNSINRVFTNSIYQNSGKFVNLSISKDSEVTSSLEINADYTINHYKWKRSCCRYKKNQCIKYCYKCEFSNSESKKNSLTINDSERIRLYKNTLFVDVSPIDSYLETTKLKINYSDTLELSFNDSYYNFYKYIFSINYSKPPYYVLTLKAEDYNKEKLHNLFKSEDSLTIKNNKECYVQAYDLFSKIESQCNTNFLGSDIKLDLDKFYYYDNERIKVNVSPHNLSVTLIYGNQTKNVTGNSTLISEYPFNRVSIYYGEKNYDKFIYVYDKSKLSLILFTILFFILIYLIYKIERKIFRRINV